MKNYILNKIEEIIKMPRLIIPHILTRGYFNWMSDDKYLKLMYYGCFGKELNLERPVSYNEKLQWLKLHDRNQVYTKLVDKYEVREHIAKEIGEEYLIPLIGVWDNFDDIDFSKLPNQFVLKCTHDSGGIVICKDKNNLNINKVRKKINKSLKRKYYYLYREWPYKNVKPRIIAEKYMSECVNVLEENDVLTDYKFFCFNGVPKIMYISKDKAKIPYTDFFDMDFNRLQIKMRDPNSPSLPKRPQEFEEMKTMATKLSKAFPHIRIDFYTINHKIYVGELTLFHCGGFASISPNEWNIKLGEWIDLSNCKS